MASDNVATYLLYISRVLAMMEAGTVFVNKDDDLILTAQAVSNELYDIMRKYNYHKYNYNNTATDSMNTQTQNNQ